MGYPFKFNRTLLQDPTFHEFISKTWKELTAKDEPPSFLTFRENMAAMRKLVKKWQIEKRKIDRQELLSVQQELDNILKLSEAGTCSFNMKCTIRELERKKYNLMKQEESFWRLKSRALWLKEGDKNTKFFHNYVIARLVCHFRKQYSRRNDVVFQDILWGIEVLPQMFDDDRNAALFRPVTENELLGILKSFKENKSPVPDGWSIEFFIHFFDLIKHDLLRMVEASRMSGSIHHYTSSTLIALIPKKGLEESFYDFRPISLCNISFKIITKIIAERIKGTLASFLTKDQHAFLKGRNILDAVANAQECLFSMSSQNSEAAIMKIDL
eukprot:PITA_28247